MRYAGDVDQIVSRLENVTCMEGVVVRVVVQVVSKLKLVREPNERVELDVKLVNQPVRRQ